MKEMHMAKTIDELMELGLSKAEAERIVNRNAKAAEKAESSKATATKRLPKAEAELAHATARKEHWDGIVTKAQAKVDKYRAVISGEDVALPIEEEAPAESEAVELDKPAPAKKASGRRK